MKHRALVLGVLLLLFPATATWADPITCLHYWKTSSGFVRSSGVVIGKDAGQSPFGTDGAYKCTVHLEKNDVLQGKYLYLGEIGDASYLELTRGPRGPYRDHLPINHGLSPNHNDHPRYERFIPFIVPVRDIYQADGEHEFMLHYRDLAPKQSGLRSGVPTLEYIGGVVLRAVRNAPALTYHLVQILLLAFLATVALGWRKTRALRKPKFVLSATFAALIIISISAVPRYLFENPNDATRLSDYINLFGFGFVLLPFTEFIKPRSNLPLKELGAVWVLATLTVAVILSRMSLESHYYIPLYCGFLLLEAGILPLAVAYGLVRHTFQTTLSAKPSHRITIALLVLGAIMVWDILVNVFTLNLSEYFVSHYFYFPIALGLLLHLHYSEPEFVSTLNDQLQVLATDGQIRVVEDEGRSFTLNQYCSELGLLLEARRVGIQQIKSDRLRFLGFFGTYNAPEEESKILPGSATWRALKTGQIVVDTAADTETGQPTSYVVIPLRKGTEIIGLLSATNFNYGYMMPFVHVHLPAIQERCQLLFSNLVMTISHRETITLLETSRLGVPEIQRDSEEYFRKHFNVSRSLRAPAFIMGDLAGSLRLRNQFKDAVTQSIDSSLRFLWANLQHLGITITREKGDFVVILAQNLDSDRDESDAALRCLEVVKFLSDPPGDYQNIPRSNGVTLDFQFRMAMSQVERSGKIPDVPRFTALTDTQIDCAGRVVGEIASGGECIVLEYVYDHLPGHLQKQLLQIPPYRIRGIDREIRMYKWRKETRKAA